MRFDVLGFLKDATWTLLSFPLYIVVAIWGLLTHTAIQLYYDYRNNKYNPPASTLKTLDDVDGLVKALESGNYSQKSVAGTADRFDRKSAKHWKFSHLSDDGAEVFVNQFKPTETWTRKKYTK